MAIIPGVLAGRLAQHRILPGIAALSLALAAYSYALVPLLTPMVPLPHLPLETRVRYVALVIFSLAHATYMLGWRHALGFVGLTTSVSWVFEQFGVQTGLIFGSYHYSGELGLKLGHVPLMIPFAWFMMAYPSYVIANLIACDQPSGSPSRPIRIILISFLGAMVMTAWDVLVDPVRSGPEVRAWIWEQGGPYFGVPLQNFVGWILTTFTVHLAYRLLESKVSPKPVGPLTVGIASMPLAAYGVQAIAATLVSNPQELWVIGPFVMGLPLLAAMTRLWKE